ncbi:MAG: acetate/propionate family kinase, partial [Planctomycetota bacterium]
MTPDVPTILTINGGSSTIKFALFHVGEKVERALHGRLHGRVEWIGAEATLTFTDPTRNPPHGQRQGGFAQEQAVTVLLDWLEAQPAFATIRAVGHRLVHGMQHSEPERVTQPLLDELKRIAPNDPEHMPREIELLEAFARRHPELPQVVCFDTAFHRTMPAVARLLPIPRRYQALGVERYGFHGLSFAYLMRALRRLGDPAATTGRVILAHLGSGASMAAVLAGKSIDTSMGFTPTSGLAMGTRSGDLDPGLVSYLARTERMTASQFQHMVNHESGLLGVSGTSADMRELLAREATDARAGEAIALFCYQAKKCIGAFAAALGGLHTLVFAGGIGEHAPAVRSRTCLGLGFLGIELDERRNVANEGVISSAASRVTVRVIRTDEESMIAEAAARVLGIAN